MLNKIIKWNLASHQQNNNVTKWDSFQECSDRSNNSYFLEVYEYPEGYQKESEEDFSSYFYIEALTKQK